MVKLICTLLWWELLVYSHIHYSIKFIIELTIFIGIFHSDRNIFNKL